MLLYANELVYLHTQGRWSFTTAPSCWQLSGKYLYLPNLLTPERALFRVNWSPSSRQQHHEMEMRELQRLLEAVDSLRYLMQALWVLLIIVLPITLLVSGTSSLLLAVLGLIYLTIVTLLFQVYRKRGDLGLTRVAFAKLAFDSLACVPLALNLLRKVTLRYPLARDPIKFAQLQFDATVFSQLVATLDQWITNELQCEEETSPRYKSLRDYQQMLTSMV